jgi:AcrR family transcriptional regulator
MAKPVKRPYTSTLRQEQAALTRSRILDAAGELFQTKGYGPTTIRQIADEAGVAVDTVYATFRTKVRVLTALIDARLAPSGDDSVLDRPEALAVRDETDQREQLRLFARDIAALSSRVRPVFELLRTAAAVEPEIAPVYAEMEGYRHRNMSQAVAWVAARGPLRVPVARARDIVWATTSPDVARLFCDVQGWSEDDYAAWLEDTLVRTLLPDPPTARRTTSRSRPRPSH